VEARDVVRVYVAIGGWRPIIAERVLGEPRSDNENVKTSESRSSLAIVHKIVAKSSQAAARVEQRKGRRKCEGNAVVKCKGTSWGRFGAKVPVRSYA
jgi:hypothetical protein